MKKKIFIFTRATEGGIYGIGTYINQLLLCLKGSEFEYEVVKLNTGEKEVKIEYKDSCKQISIPKVNNLNIIKSSYYSKNVAYLLRELTPYDNNTQYIFHLNFMGDEVLVTYLKQMFRSKVIVVAHYIGWDFDLLGNHDHVISILKKVNNTLLNTLDEKIYETIRKDEKMINKCDKFICVANHIYDSYRKVCSLKKHEKIIINNGVLDQYERITDAEKRVIKQKYHISANTKILLFAGRLDKGKGLAFLIQAFKELLKTYPNLHLFIAGSGDYNSFIVESKDCWSKISFTGRLDKEQLYEFYNISDIGILPSLHEAFGLVAIEMMMHELPIVVTNIGGLAEIVEDNISGLKVSINKKQDQHVVDVSMLIEKIQLLLNNNSLAKEMGKRARKRYLEKYELSIFSKEILSLYENI